jgi:electron transfer flavoprotein alpha subunit
LIAHGVESDRTLTVMLALVPIRDGVLPAGAAEAIAECDGRLLLAGSGTGDVVLDGLASHVYLVELGPVEPNRWTSILAPVLEDLDGADIVVLPHSPDGRDLAPHLALALARPLYAGATHVSDHRVRVARRGGLELHEQRPTGAFVATLQPGARGVDTFATPPRVEQIAVPALGAATADAAADARVVEVLPPDVRTMDLAEAARIVGGGAGLQTEERFAQLDRFAATIGGVMGATRVVTDRGWVHHDRQIGTTGVVVDPVVYVSFGVSGAVQHTSGLGAPDHIISINTDPHCPMMAMSDLAIVADANETLDELLALLDEPLETGAELGHG